MRRPLVAAAALLAAVPALAAASVEWTPVATMSSARFSPTATPITAGASSIKGKVLVAGGYNGSACVTSAQLFDPNTNAWSPTGALRTSRAFATATDLGDGTGRVLVAGGFTSTLYGWSTVRTAEIYNPATGTFSYVARTVKNKSTQVSMNQYRELFTGTRLPNGKILLAGGIYGGQTTVSSAELFDPAAVTFTYTGTMRTPAGRFGHDAVLIPPAPAGSPFYDPSDQGKVLLVGGKEHASDGWHSLQTADLYDVASGTFTSVPMQYPRDRPRAVWVPSVGQRGMVLVVGGKSESPRDPAAVRGDVLPTEWFDPTTRTFTEGPALQQGRMAHTLDALADGSILVAGGWSDTLGRTTDTAERFVPDADPGNVLHGAFVSLTTMGYPRQDHASVALPALGAGPRVLVVGGKPNVGGRDTYLNTAEIYTPR